MPNLGGFRFTTRIYLPLVRQALSSSVLGASLAVCVSPLKAFCRLDPFSSESRSSGGAACARGSSRPSGWTLPPLTQRRHVSYTRDAEVENARTLGTRSAVCEGSNLQTPSPNQAGKGERFPSSQGHIRLLQAFCLGIRSLQKKAPAWRERLFKCFRGKAFKLF